MSRVYQKPAAATTGASRRPPANPQGTVRPTGHQSNTAANRSARAPTQAQSMRTPATRPTGSNKHLPNTNRQDRTTTTTATTHVGDGFHMITPSMIKREQIMKQAETEQRLYEEHIERTRLRNIHEVHRLGGNSLSEQEARQKQADKYRREKFARLEKTHQNQLEKKQEEQRVLDDKKQAARSQALKNENDQEGATGWTDAAREDDRKRTMDQFLNRLTNQCQNVTLSSDNTSTDQSKSEKLAILRETLPHIDEATLETYLESYNGNVDGVISAFLD